MRTQLTRIHIQSTTREGYQCECVCAREIMAELAPIFSLCSPRCLLGFVVASDWRSVYHVLARGKKLRMLWLPAENLSRVKISRARSTYTGWSRHFPRSVLFLFHFLQLVSEFSVFRHFFGLRISSFCQMPLDSHEPIIQFIYLAVDAPFVKIKGERKPTISGFLFDDGNSARTTPTAKPLRGLVRLVPKIPDHAQSFLLFSSFFTRT